MIAPGAYFLLERTDDRSVADIAADQVYSGALSNAGELQFALLPTKHLLYSAPCI